MKRTVTNGIALAVLLTGVVAVVRGTEPKAGASAAAPASAKLASIAWIAGSWRADSGGDQLDEQWSAPSGDSMFGSFRWMKDGKAWMFEMLTIMDEADGVVMRIKHFDNKGLGWEEKADAVTLKLVRSDSQTAEFERIQSDKDTRVVYRLQSPGELIVTLDRTTKDGPKKDEHHFRRVGH